MTVLCTSVSSSQSDAQHKNFKNVKKTVFFVFVDEVIYAKAGAYFEVGAECLYGRVSGFLNLVYSSVAVGGECVCGPIICGNCDITFCFCSVCNVIILQT